MDKNFEKIINFAIFGFGIFVNFVGLLFSSTETRLVTSVSLIINIVIFIIFSFLKKNYTLSNFIVTFFMGFLTFPTILFLSSEPKRLILYNLIIPIIYAITIKNKRNLILPSLNLLCFFFIIIYKINITTAIIFSVIYGFQFFLVSLFSLKLFNFTYILQETNKRLKEAARKDPLTGLYNRYGFIEKIKLPRQYTAIMLDIDNFKKINDEYGHFEGDRILKDLAKIILTYSDQKFISCRWGGEEFLILSEYRYRYNIKLIKSILSDVDSFLLTNDNKNITISIGISKKGVLDNLENGSLVKEADDDLYIAKNNGRARVCYNSKTILKMKQ